MGNTLYSKYFKTLKKLKSYQGNSYGIKVKLPSKELTPSDNVTANDIKELENSLRSIQNKINKATNLVVKQSLKDASFNNRLNSLLFGKNPEVHTVKKITSDVRVRQQEYERMRKSLQSSARYYKNRYDVNLQTLPRLEKNQVPTRRQLKELEYNIRKMKRIAKEGISEANIAFENAVKLINTQINLKGNHEWDDWETAKARKLYDLIVVPYQNDKKGFLKKYKNMKVKVDEIVETFIYTNYETYNKNMQADTMRTDLWDLLSEILGKA